MRQAMQILIEAATKHLEQGENHDRLHDAVNSAFDALLVECWELEAAHVQYYKLRVAAERLKNVGCYVPGTVVDETFFDEWQTAAMQLFDVIDAAKQPQLKALLVNDMPPRVVYGDEGAIVCVMLAMNKLDPFKGIGK